MKKVFLFVFIIISFQNLHSQWYWVSPLPQGNGLNAFTYSNGIFDVFGNYGTILRTSNDGVNWTFKNRVNDLPHNITLVYRFSDNIIYAAGERSPQNYSLLKSTDNGANWNTITYNNPQFTEVLNFCFVNQNTGYYVSNSQVKKTTNGGINWSAVYTNEADDNFINIYFVNELTGFACGGSQFFYAEQMIMTSNGGLTWVTVIPDEVDMIGSIQFINETTGYAAAMNTVFKTTNGGVNWFDRGSTEMNLLIGLHFVDAQTGYAVSGYDPEIYRTTNGGNNWTSHNVPVYGLSDILFINVNTGYLFGENSSIIKTTNSGNNWTTVHSYTSNSSLLNLTSSGSNNRFAIGWNATIKKSTDNGVNWYNTSIHNFDRHLRDAVFLNPNTGYAIAYDSYFGNLLKTTDAGENWYLIDTIGSTDIRLNELHFISTDIGFILDEEGNLFRTMDNGSTWNIVFTAPGGMDLVSMGLTFGEGFLVSSNNVQSVVYKTSNTGTTWTPVFTYPHTMTKINASGNTAFLLGKGILKTTNGGLNWEQKYNGNIQDYTFTDVHFPSSTTGYAVGRTYGDMDQGVIFKTIDAGEHWNMLRIPTNMGINSVLFSNVNTGIIAGQSGVIMRTTNGGGDFLSNITTSTTEIPEGYSLNQNYPNPFNPSTNISFDIPKNSLVELKVFDITGRLVSTLVNETLSPGSYNYNWNGEGLSSGIYFYTLSSGEFISTKKMLLLK